ncbi:MAG: hypothetical protein E3J72_08095 [Planctomycetota bacterium]|nr:MAG: hypothetical protein E3J72_08095 [Planctomycetota bacterium]
MSGSIIPVNGKAECHARMALTDGCGKWEPGTILELYPLDHHFEWGDQAHFLVISAELDETQIELIRQRKLKVPLESFLSPKSLKAYNDNLSLEREDFLASGEKPRFDRKVDVKTLAVNAPEWQWVKESAIDNDGVPS